MGRVSCPAQWLNRPIGVPGSRDDAHRAGRSRQRKRRRELLPFEFSAGPDLGLNPKVPTGRAAMVGFISRRTPTPLPVEPRIKAPLVSIVAERDLVILSFVREYPEPQDATRKYTTTWFDMFRLEGGKIVEHWDGAMKPPKP